ncbi:glycoside hydrolase family 93 protein [Myriangium duriaei CBS 260.36]|uniref:Glycoside hydrolase family 93 protein n=1 Tax=Myriangium duriaei CBS 260.36 TaxID=1168546 RepID=A0A9P4MEH4_9PEZI|nr:glycoside hydrolase family 93 protein [Myriangium duriaei CBS 260.36]
MKWAWGIFSLALASVATAAKPAETYTNVTVFDPPADYTIPRTLYARTLQLPDGTLLSTWENYLPNNDSNPYFPIYESCDNGKTWSERSRLYDQVNHWGARYQPFLYQLPQNVGAYKKGDILLAGNFIPNDLSQTKIDIYVSSDNAKSWRFVSSVARGGEALPNNGLTPVWEPFLMVYKNQLVCFYSDQRDFTHNGQKLVHQTSTDLVNWGSVVNDVAYNNTDWRPGMTTVSALPNGKYIMTYEFYGAVEAAFAVYYRVADSPLLFNEAQGYVVKATDGTVPVSSPYNVWTPVGGKDGSIIVSCGTLSQIFINHDLATPGSPWQKVEVPAGISYTRSLRILKDPSELLIVGGGVLSGTNNSVLATLVKVPACKKKSISCYQFLIEIWLLRSCEIMSVNAQAFFVLYYSCC